jgi:hypothetical protein
MIENIVPDIETLKRNVAAQSFLIGQSGGDLNGYIKRFGEVTGREKYAADTSVLAGCRESLHEVVNDAVLADLLGD